jgi:hypothetical protein
VSQQIQAGFGRPHPLSPGLDGDTADSTFSNRLNSVSNSSAARLRIDSRWAVSLSQRMILFQNLLQTVVQQPDAVAQRTLCETARGSEDRLQDDPAVRDERHEEAQHAA